MLCYPLLIFFFFNDTATTEIYTLSLHDALPISARGTARWAVLVALALGAGALTLGPHAAGGEFPAIRSGRAFPPDRKSTRLNSSHLVISYAVFCLKKKTLTFLSQTARAGSPTPN